MSTVRAPQPGDTITFSWISNKDYRIAEIFGSHDFDWSDGPEWSVRVEHGTETWSYVLTEREYGAKWEYVR